MHVHNSNSITIVSRNQTVAFSYESLALQDYNNKALDDGLATVPCLDLEARRWARNAELNIHKASAVR